MGPLRVQREPPGEDREGDLLGAADRAGQHRAQAADFHANRVAQLRDLALPPELVLEALGEGVLGAGLAMDQDHLLRVALATAQLVVAYGSHRFEVTPSRIRVQHRMLSF